MAAACPTIRRWRDHGAVPRRAKWMASAMMLASSTVLWLSPAPLAMRIAAPAVMAAVALWVWQHSQAGLLHDLAFVVMFLGAVSSLLVNGNPLLRMDGYHALCDALDLPNLAARSRRWWLRVGSRLVNGPGHAAAEDHHRHVQLGRRGGDGRLGPDLAVLARPYTRAGGPSGWRLRPRKAPNNHERMPITRV